MKAYTHVSSRRIPSGVRRVSAAVLALAGFDALAAEYHWTGAASADFADPANWLVEGSIPAAPPANSDGGRTQTDGDSVVIGPHGAAATNAVIIPAPWALRTMSVTEPGWTISAITGGGAVTNLLSLGIHGGLAVTHGAGTTVFEGALSLGSTDTPAVGWSINSNAVLRQRGTIARRTVGGGGGGIRKTGAGTIEFEVEGAIPQLTVEGGRLVNISGSGALHNKADLRQGGYLNLQNNSVYDINGNNMNLGGLAIGANAALVNTSAKLAAVSTEQKGNAAFAGYIGGAIAMNITGNSPLWTISITCPTNDFSGAFTFAPGLTVVLGADTAPGSPGALGVGDQAVVVGSATGNGGGQANIVSALLLNGSYEFARVIKVGSGDRAHHRIGTTADAAGVAVFSGGIEVGLGSSWNGDNPHLEIYAGTNAIVDITGNVTNCIVRPDSPQPYALRNGKIQMLGPGEARLFGANTHTGGTEIFGGTLIAAATDSLGPAGVLVSTNAVLAGEASARGLTTVLSNGSLSAGMTGGAGTLTLTQGLAMENGARLLIDVDGDATDCVLVSGGVLTLPQEPVAVDVRTVSEMVWRNHVILDWTDAETAAAPDVSDFILGQGAEDYKLDVIGARLVLRPLGAHPATLIFR